MQKASEESFFVSFNYSPPPTSCSSSLAPWMTHKILSLNQEMHSFEIVHSSYNFLDEATNHYYLFSEMFQFETNIFNADATF